MLFIKCQLMLFRQRIGRQATTQQLQRGEIWISKEKQTKRHVSMPKSFLIARFEEEMPSKSDTSRSSKLSLVFIWGQLFEGKSVTFFRQYVKNTSASACYYILDDLIIFRGHHTDKKAKRWQIYLAKWQQQHTEISCRLCVSHVQIPDRINQFEEM